MREISKIDNSVVLTFKREKKVRGIGISLGTSLLALGHSVRDWLMSRYNKTSIAGRDHTPVFHLPLAMTEILLPPFNGQLNLRNAYNWDRNQVSFFLTCGFKRLLKTEIRSIIFLKMSSIIMPIMVYSRTEWLS
jgi:hypothetical protein